VWKGYGFHEFKLLRLVRNLFCRFDNLLDGFR
jgi:hypothetical protein